MGRDARKPVFGVCEQQRRRPACASTQSDRAFAMYHIETCYNVQAKFQLSS